MRNFWTPGHGLKHVTAITPKMLTPKAKREIREAHHRTVLVGIKDKNGLWRQQRKVQYLIDGEWFFIADIAVRLGITHTSVCTLLRRDLSFRWADLEHRGELQCWLIDGEKFTIQEIVQRLGISKSGVVARLDRGQRTWAELKRNHISETAKKNERKRLLWARAQAEKRAYFSKLAEGHAKL